MSENTTSLGTAISTDRQWSNWLFIPGPNGNPFKAECRRAALPGQIATADDGQSVQVVEEKCLNWFADDPRLDRPHTHGFPFVSIILAGEISEKRWQRQANGQYMYCGTFTWKAGQAYYCGEDVAHSVFGVAPGTKTHMFLGPRVGGAKDWGHLILSVGQMTGIYQPNEVDPEFLARFKNLNNRPA